MPTMFIRARSLSGFRFGVFERKQRTGDGDLLARHELLPLNVLIPLSAESVRRVREISDDPNRHVRPAKRPNGSETTRTSDQSSAAVNHYRMKQSEFIDTGGEGPNVSDVLPMPFADSYVADFHRSEY